MANTAPDIRRIRRRLKDKCGIPLQRAVQVVNCGFLLQRTHTCYGQRACGEVSVSRVKDGKVNVQNTLDVPCLLHPLESSGNHFWR